MTGKRGKKLTECIISGHYYKMFEDVTKQIEEDHYYVKCERCGDRRIIHDKSYYDRISGKYKL